MEECWCYQLSTDPLLLRMHAGGPACDRGSTAACPAAPRLHSIPRLILRPTGPDRGTSLSPSMSSALCSLLSYRCDVYLRSLSCLLSRPLPISCRIQVSMSNHVKPRFADFTDNNLMDRRRRHDCCTTTGNCTTTGSLSHRRRRRRRRRLCKAFPCHQRRGTSASWHRQRWRSSGRRSSCSSSTRRRNLTHVCSCDVGSRPCCCCLAVCNSVQ